MSQAHNQESTNIKKQQMEVSIQKKRECLRKSKSCVERLLEEDVSEFILLENLNHMTRSDYEDVVEERSIIKLCGYPLCQNKLTNVPNKKYHISSTTNKIYDITERKKFCSNRCYQASEYLQQQISTSPVWLRDAEDMTHFQLLARLEHAGRVGEQVTLSLTKQPTDQVKVNHIQSDFVSAFAMSTLVDLERIGGACYESLFIREQHVVPVEATSVQDLDRAPHDAPSVTKDENAPRTDKLVNSEREVSSRNKENQQNIDEQTAPTSCVITCDMNIVSTRNLEDQYPASVVTNESLTKQDLSHSPNDALVSNKNIAELTVETSNKPAECRPSQHSVKHCLAEKTKIMHGDTQIRKEAANSVTADRKIGVQRVEAVAFEWFTLDTAIYLFGADVVTKKLGVASDQVTAASCDHSQLIKLCEVLLQREKAAEEKMKCHKKELSMIEYKVKGFYEGKTATAILKEPEIKPILPDVDRYNQISARQKIVLGKISKVLPDVLTVLRVNCIGEVTSEVHNLIHTFTLGPHNTMLQPDEWALMSLLIMKMLCVKLPLLQEEMSCNKSKKSVARMLKSFHLKENYLDQLIKKLCGEEN